MNLLFVIILCLICSITAQAQSFKGVIVNAETQQPVSQVTILNEDQSFFTTSNELGEVVLPQHVVNQKLFIGVYEYVYSEKTFTSTHNFTWELQPNSETLEEIVIYENPEVYLQDVIKNSIKSFSKNTRLETYYRENYIQNNETASFADGLVDFYVNDIITMVAKQTRVKDISDVNPANRSMANPPTQLVDISMRFSVLSTMLKEKNKYEFYVTSKQVGDKTIHTCYINPLEKSKKRFLMKGYFVFDDTEKLILETNYFFDPDKKKYNTTMNVVLGKFDFNDIRFKSKFF